MATAVETTKATRPLEAEQRVLLRDVGWQGYETLLAMVGDGYPRLACDGKDVELMSPSTDHENFKTLIARLIETLTLELNIPCDGLGSTTWRKALKRRGLEPDECYYLGSSGRVDLRRIDLNVDPPPDLAVEVEISRSALDRLAIYAALGVPEVWRFDGERLTVEQLQGDGTYATVPASPSLPFLPLDEFARWIHRGRATGQTPWLREFREWVRAELAPRFENR